MRDRFARGASVRALQVDGAGGDVRADLDEGAFQGWFGAEDSNVAAARAGDRQEDRITGA